jgi:phosphate uptake regulator
MTEIYLEISKLSDKFRTMAYGLIPWMRMVVNEAVQELMLYFLQANPDVIRSIYEKDGIEGITKYGAVALRRALTSPRSNYYYKYKEVL